MRKGYNAIIGGASSPGPRAGTHQPGNVAAHTMNKTIAALMIVVCLTFLAPVVGASAPTPAPTVAKTHAVGSIKVKTWNPKPYDQPAGGPKMVQVSVTETFSGDIQGDGTVQFLQMVRPDGSASFVGMERVTGEIGGRHGSFVLQDSGTLIASHVTGSWFVVPGSGTGELHGLRGDGGFSADLGKDASITLDYWFENANVKAGS